MSLLDVIRDGRAAPSVVYAAVAELLGPGSGAWEPDTVRIELFRRGVRVELDVVMAKWLGAQTVHQTTVWTYDHDALFAFAVACDGVPAASDAHHHPTPEQLCWAFEEIRRLRGVAPDDQNGVDCDAVDPAIAVVLHDEGMVLAPRQLAFVQDVLDRFAKGSVGLKKRVEATWLSLSLLTPDVLRRTLKDEPVDAEGVQVRRLAECALYVAERADWRARHDATLRALSG